MIEALDKKMKAIFKQAAKESIGTTCYVVHVPDEGTQIMNVEQYKRWQEIVFLEATFMNGVQISTNK